MNVKMCSQKPEKAVQFLGTGGIGDYKLLHKSTQNRSQVLCKSSIFF